MKRSPLVKPARPTTSPHFSWAILLVVICVIAAGILIAAGQPFGQADVATDRPQPNAIGRPDSTVAARAETKKTLPLKVPAMAAPARRSANEATIATTPAPVLVVESHAKALSVEPAANGPAVGSTAKADAPMTAPVTITGCLERDDETFRLKETVGVDAPRSRSWRSGFLKKRSSSVEVVDAANTLRLPNHVGQRITATGILVNRTMQVRSLRRLPASCS